MYVYAAIQLLVTGVTTVECNGKCSMFEIVSEVQIQFGFDKCK